jgi:hypothetical protein
VPRGDPSTGVLCTHACVRISRAAGGIDREHRRRNGTPGGAAGRAHRRRREGGTRRIHRKRWRSTRAAAHHRHLRRPRPYRYRPRNTPRGPGQPFIAPPSPPIGRLGRPEEVRRWCACCAGPDGALYHRASRSTSMAALICHEAS